jgi:hypothetical protein
MAGINEAFSSQFTPWVASSVNSISLNSNALSALASNNDTVMGVMNYTNDYQNSAPATSPYGVGAGIAFGTTIQLEYFEAGEGPANVKKLNSVGSQDISRWNGVSWADIVALNSVT